MKFSVFYKVQAREKFFSKFWAKEKKKVSSDVIQIVEFNYRETLEIITSYVMNRNRDNLKILLARTNSKVARIFFDYLTGAKTRNLRKEEVIKTIDNIFDGDIFNEEH